MRSFFVGWLPSDKPSLDHTASGTFLRLSGSSVFCLYTDKLSAVGKIQVNFLYLSPCGCFQRSFVKFHLRSVLCCDLLITAAECIRRIPGLVIQQHPLAIFLKETVY